MRRLERIIAAISAEIVPYIHELEDWPEFRWDHKVLAEQLAAVRHRQGRLVGRMEGLGFPLRSEAMLNTLTEDVLKSSEIEGEILNRDQVRSSIARRLGMDIGGLVPADRDVEGVVEMMLDATQNHEKETDRRAAVRLACGALSDRAQRDAPHHGRRVARRQVGTDAGDLGTSRPRARPLRSAAGDASRRRHEGFS
jgi:Fic family protein